jgi:DNA-binding beta-propeller fold protein YncE
LAKNAKSNRPLGIATGASGKIYIADGNNNRIRMISSGTISTVIGTGVKVCIFNCLYVDSLTYAFSWSAFLSRIRFCDTTL